jgi:type II secretory pathway component PulF
VRWIVDRLPVVGAASRAAEAAAWCRAAALASAAGLPAGRLVSLASLAAPGNSLDPARFEESLRRGATLTDALRTTGLFSDRLLAGVSIGEATGTTAEVLDRLAGEFDDEARRGLEAAAQGVGFLVWAMVAGLIIMLIFRIFSFYVATLQGLTKGR